MAAIKKAGYEGRVKIAMDVAASEFYKEESKQYDLDFKNTQSDKSKWLSGAQLGDSYRQFLKDYPIVSIEDPFDQDDWESWVQLTGSVRT